MITVVVVTDAVESGVQVVVNAAPHEIVYTPVPALSPEPGLARVVYCHPSDESRVREAVDAEENGRY